MTAAIPIVDLAGLDTPAGRSRIGQDLDRAYSALGFAYVTNHGVPAEAIDAVFEASARFHALPETVKQAIAVNRHHRGYLGFASGIDRASNIEAAAHPNLSESFIKLYEPEPGESAANPLDGPNQWPAGLAGFKDTVLAYEARLERLARALVRVMAEVLAGEAAALDPAFERPTSWLRLLHYPARPADAPPGLYGSAPHTDFGAFTILAQDAAGGLQVREPSGEWIDVPPCPGTFVVNTGEAVPVWSGGRWRSTPHRVVNPKGRERYSVAYFFDPGFDTVIAPLSPVDAENPEDSVAGFRFGDHVMSQLDATYDYREADARA
ncbi:MAG TPA: 2-oxoglutarate and iron-dependent oxygenase domain-containing protein [Alphaproteobacteria bacterium]|nr:2-oxoglutarate and iron-dependent oxygenase domain-containing protein [Alphaproteobacteria bacterium]